MIHLNLPLKDITDRISEPPKWWLSGIPRYCDYHPHETFRAELEILVRVGCSSCAREFNIAISASEMLGPGLTDLRSGLQFWDAYPNPPWHCGLDGFNCFGNTCGVEPFEVMQAWEQAGPLPLDWVRLPDLEGMSLPIW